MKCPICGAELADGAKFCEYCGSPVAAEAAPAPAQEAAPAKAAAPAPQPQQQAQPQYQQPQARPAQPQYAQPQAAYQQPGAYQQPQTLTPKCKTFGIISFVLGLWSTAFSWLSVLGVFGIVMGVFMIGSAIVGLIFSNISRKEGNFKLARLGKVFSIIGLILSAIFWIIAIIAVATTGGSHYRYYW